MTKLGQDNWLDEIITVWETQPKGTTPLPKLIEGLAKGTHKVEQGIILAKTEMTRRQWLNTMLS